MPTFDTPPPRAAADTTSSVISSTPGPSASLEGAPTRGASAGALSEQGRLAKRLLASIHALEREVNAIVRPLTPSQRGARPATGGWSVDELLEHLCLANADYLGVMERALSDSARPLERGRWRATVGGWLLVKAMESERRTSAPSSIVPSSTPREAVLDAMIASLHRLRLLIDGAGTAEWRRVRMTSPYARWLRLNFGDAALVVVRHAERHVRQMARVASEAKG